MVEWAAVRVKSCSRATQQMFRSALGSSGVPRTHHSPAFKEECIDSSAAIQTILKGGQNSGLLLLFSPGMKYLKYPSKREYKF